MTFANYQNSNNASSKLLADISASTTVILITSWEEALFPNSYPFLLTIEKVNSDWNVILREIVKVVSWNQNSFVVERWAWICVQDDTATTKVQSNASHSFTSWSRISLFWTSEQVKDIQDNIADNITNIWLLDWRMTQAETDIEALKKAWKIDKLMRNAVIGERITSSDQLFLQYTPKAEDCNIAMPVWKEAANTQVHIQRVSSLTAWNTLKMKIRMNGSPTTKFVAEIQKATLVNDTNEDYRYGDWTTIATAEIPYTSFTTQRQEFTLTFDNEFWWWEEKELISVIVHQENDVVNASNFYEIACDQTQYSEWLRAVFVNGSTRTYNKIIPYCEWTWLENAIISKCDTTQYSSPYNIPLIENLNILSDYDTQHLAYTHAIDPKWWTNIYATWTIVVRRWSNSSRYSYCYLFKGEDWTKLWDWSWAWWWTTYTVNWSYSITANSWLIFEVWRTYQNISLDITDLNIWTTNWKLSKSTTWVYVKTDETWNVGDDIDVIIYWSAWDEYFEWWFYNWRTWFNLDCSASADPWKCWFVAPVDWYIYAKMTNEWNWMNSLIINGASFSYSVWFPVKAWDQVIGDRQHDWVWTYGISLQYRFMQ